MFSKLEILRFFILLFKSISNNLSCVQSGMEKLVDCAEKYVYMINKVDDKVIHRLKCVDSSCRGTAKCGYEDSDVIQLIEHSCDLEENETLVTNLKEKATTMKNIYQGNMSMDGGLNLLNETKCLYDICILFPS